MSSTHKTSSEFDEEDLLKSDTESVKSTSSILSTNEEFMALLKDIKRDQCTKSDLEKINKNIDTKFKAVQSQLNSQADHIVKLNTRMDNMEKDGPSEAFKKLSARIDNFESKSQMAQHEMELSKQKLLRNNLSIMGIPFQENENLKDISISIFKFINCNPSTDTINGSYRIKGHANNIFIIKLEDYNFKQNVLTNKTKKSIKVKDIITCDSNLANNTVYINNHVTPHFGRLLAEGRKAVKNGKIFSVWMTSLGTQIKFEENGKQLLYHSVEQLHQLIGENVKEKPRTTKRSTPDDNSPSTSNMHKSKK